MARIEYDEALKRGLKKTCSVCLEDKPVDQFNRRASRARSSGVSGTAPLYNVQSKCRACANAYNRTWTQSEYYKATQKRRQYNIKHQYGMTLRQYDEMKISQDGRCAICRRPPNETRKLVIDHCHATGVVRGLLCEGCNTSLGVFRDDVTTLQRAIDYVKAHQIEWD